MYGAELTKPTFHSSAEPPGWSYGMAMPNSVGNDRSDRSVWMFAYSVW